MGFHPGLYIDFASWDSCCNLYPCRVFLGVFFVDHLPPTPFKMMLQRWTTTLNHHLFRKQISFQLQGSHEDRSILCLLSSRTSATISSCNGWTQPRPNKVMPTKQQTKKVQSKNMISYGFIVKIVCSFLLRTKTTKQNVHYSCHWKKLSLLVAHAVLYYPDFIKTGQHGSRIMVEQVSRSVLFRNEKFIYIATYTTSTQWHSKVKWYRVYYSGGIPALMHSGKKYVEKWQTTWCTSLF